MMNLIWDANVCDKKNAMAKRKNREEYTMSCK